MNQKELKELIEFLIEKDIAEFELERGDVKVRIKRGADARFTAPPETRYVQMAPPSAPPPEYAPPPAVAAAAPGKPVAEEMGLHEVKSPIVGTFYRSPSPEASAFAEVGQKITRGKILCIIESMKLMNEIESDVEGEILEVYPSNGQPVEYGEKLFAIRLAA